MGLTVHFVGFIMGFDYPVFIAFCSLLPLWVGFGFHRSILVDLGMKKPPLWFGGGFRWVGGVLRGGRDLLGTSVPS